MTTKKKKKKIKKNSGKSLHYPPEKIAKESESLPERINRESEIFKMIPSRFQFELEELQNQNKSLISLGPYFYPGSHSLYKGQYKYGLKYGAGCEEIADEVCYEGEYFNDNFHGQGIMLNKQEEILVAGDFVHGQPEGYVFILSNFDE